MLYLKEKMIAFCNALKECEEEKETKHICTSHESDYLSNEEFVMVPFSELEDIITVADGSFRFTGLDGCFRFVK